MWTTKKVYLSAYVSLLSLLTLTYFTILPVTPQMLIYTVSIIIIGAHNSLKLHSVNKTTGEKEHQIESVSHKDAMLFPFIGSIALLSLYVAYKFLSRDVLNALVSAYLSLVGALAIGETFRPIFSDFLNFRKLDDVQIKIKCPQVLKNLYSMVAKLPEDHENLAEFSLLSFLTSAFFGLPAAFLFWYTKHYIPHNLLAICFSIQAISYISVGRFSIAGILLGGLFFYDIFWVFGTDVMVTVAKNFDAPAKIIFPLSFDPWKNGILGLGDIVLPGVLLSLCLRYDWYKCIGQHDSEYVKIEKKEKEEVWISTVFIDIDVYQDGYEKSYFYHCLGGYILGLICTSLIMTIFNAAQPALLYLVPGTFLGVGICSYRLQDFHKMWTFNEADASICEKKKQ